MTYLYFIAPAHKIFQVMIKKYSIDKQQFKNCCLSIVLSLVLIQLNIVLIVKYKTLHIKVVYVHLVAQTSEITTLIRDSKSH